MTLPRLPLATNYASLPLQDALVEVNPQQEINAKQMTTIVNDLTACGITAPRLIFQFTGSSTLPVITPSITWPTGWDSMWGNNILNRPVLTRVSTGVINIQVPALVPDFVGNTNLTNVRCAKCSTVGGNTFLNYMIGITSSSTFTVQICNLAGTLVDGIGSLILIEVF